eukprot:GFYU01001292.1.p1 GENE.GFYU01001292.1~~GFYU01001292.1.p1  ORF type:complete len:100 (+),score=23.62 GFYU01001292.1:30-329(+)
MKTIILFTVALFAILAFATAADLTKNKNKSLSGQDRLTAVKYGSPDMPRKLAGGSTGRWTCCKIGDSPAFCTQTETCSSNDGRSLNSNEGFCDKNPNCQ